MKLNPNEAPKGYRARRARKPMQCWGCDMYRPGQLNNCTMPVAKCLPGERKDDCSVIFIKAPKRPSLQATFARWWKRQPNNWRAAMRVFGGDSIEALARRAWNAGRRVTKKERN